MATKKIIKVQNLMLDPKNYRIDVQEGQPQAIRAIIDEQGTKLATLAEDIIENGLSPIELFMVCAVEGSKTRYMVMEGNRRTTAIKLVLKPDLAIGTSLEKTFRKLNAKHVETIVQKVEAIVENDKKKIKLWMRRRHDRNLKGAGLEDWTSAAKDRADADEGKSSIALDVRNFVVANGDFDETTKALIRSNKFKSTNLTRLLETAYVREMLGITRVDSHFVSNANSAWVHKILRSGPENSDSSVSGCFASQFRLRGRTQEQKHDQENETKPFRQFQSQSGTGCVAG